MPTSYSLYNNNTQSLLPLPDKSMTLGRSENCRLRLLDGDASREHARLFRSIGGLTIVDLGSTNGTYVNGVKISEAKHLQPGDIIGIASERFTVKMEADYSNATRMADVIGMTRVGKVIMVPPPRESWRTRFFSFFSFLWRSKARATSSEPPFAEEHQANIDKYLQHFQDAEAGDKAVLFFHKNNKTLAVHCVAEGTEDNHWSLGRCETNYISITDASVSKHHATLSCKRGKWLLEDHSSTNGIMLNGVRKESIKLTDEADVRLGDVKVYVRLLS